MHRAIYIYVLSILLLFPLDTLCQIRFAPLETDVSLSLVNAIHRDHEGFLWIGNEELGLMKYDSQHTIRYKHDSLISTSICNDAIADIKEDKDHNIWIGTSHGLSRYISVTNSFINYYHSDNDSSSLPNNYIESIFIDDLQQVWILTANGLCRYNSAEDNFIRYNIKIPGHSNYICEMACDNNGNLWVVTLFNGIYLFNPQTSAFTHFPDPKMSKSLAMTKKILIDSDNTIWIGSYEFGVAHFNPSSETFTYLPQNTTNTGINSTLVTSMLEWVPGIILFGFDQGGINLLNKHNEHITYITSENHIYGELSSDGIYCMHKDSEGILWVGTSRGGINYYSEKAERFRSYTRKESYPMTNGHSYPTPSYNICGCFYEDANGTIWLGTDGGGLNAFNPKKQEFTVFKHRADDPTTISSNVIRGITEDKNGNLYVATLDKGINVFDRQSGQFKKTLIEEKHRVDYQNSFLWSIFRDSQNRIWTSNPKGYVSLYDQNLKLIKHDYIQISYTLDQKILFCENINGTIFFNSLEGVYRVSDHKAPPTLFIELPSVSFIFADDPRCLWIGTERDGLYQFNTSGKMLRHFTTKEGLADNYICAIASGMDDELWITTNNGLSKLNTNNGTFTNYTREDGLIDNQFFIQSILKTKDEHILLGTSKGFAAFKPKNIQINRIPPKIYLSDLYINNEKIDFKNTSSTIDKPIRYINEITLKPDQRTLTFDFKAINYTFPEKNRFQYILDGFDSKWTVTTNLNKQAHYTNLDPGIYTFKVKAANNDGIWNKEPVQLKITILPPFWKTNWFISSASVILVIIILLIIKVRERKLINAKVILQKKVSERTQVIEDQKEELLAQHDELVRHREQLENLVVERTHDLIAAKEKAEKSDRLKSYFLANISHEIRTPMNAIIGFASLLNDPGITQEQQKDFITLITSNSESLLYLIEDILDFSMIESDQLKVINKTFELNSFIDHIYSSFALRNPNPEITIRLNNRLKYKNIKIYSDEFRIKQIIDNLLSNAFKFTDRGFIDITVDASATEVLFIVSDTGHGISEADQANVFNQFVKLEADQVSAKRGLGLGLAISKRLTELLQGQLYLKSTIGKGSEFTLTLPKTIMVEAKLYRQESFSTSTIKKNWSNKSILIAEDEKSNYLFLMEVLKPTSAQITWAKDGQEAMAHFNHGEQFDLVLLDIKMPNMDGYTTFERIRERHPSQIIIAQTAYARKEDERQILEKGFTDYLPKPMNQKSVLDTLSKYLD